MNDVSGNGQGAGPEELDPGREPVGTKMRFEDLRAWQAARELAKLTYAATRGTQMGRDSSLCRQMQRAAVSAMANIAEGHGRTGLGEFAHFLSLALGSLTELRSHLYVALDTSLISRETFDEVMAKALCTGQITGALRSAVERRKNSARTVRESPAEYSICAGEKLGHEHGDARMSESLNLPPTPYALSPSVPRPEPEAPRPEKEHSA